ncbi:MAG: hypothetical protein ACRDH6_06745 [Actinomycetota bacterium]
MGRVIRLDEWRSGREREDSRLERAVGRLDLLVEERDGEDAPTWFATEVLAIQGCISLGLLDEAARRTERLIERCEHPSSWGRKIAR